MNRGYRLGGLCERGAIPGLVAGALLVLDPCARIEAAEGGALPAPGGAGAAEPTGWRERMAARGVEFSAGYQLEVIGNVSGGFRQAAIAEGLVKVGIDFDLEKLVGWPAATFHVSSLYPHGASPSGKLVGDLLTMSNLDAPDSLRLFEVWLEQGFWDGKLSLRAGQLAADEEFAGTDHGCLFVHAATGWPPMISMNVPAPAYPAAAPGVRLEVRPLGEWFARVGVYDGDPDPGDANGEPLNRHGERINLGEGAFVISEVGLGWNQGEESTGYPGTAKVGGWIVPVGRARLSLVAWVDCLFSTGRLRRWVWGHWYPFLTRRLRAEDVLFLNYAFEEAPAMGIPLEPRDEQNRGCIQLYHHVASLSPIRGRDVLEVSCGHGGGADYLVRTFQPRSYRAIDLNPDGIGFCRSRHRLPGLEFTTGDASRLPVRDGSVDAVINVEASHCYPDLVRFLGEVARVLRPGGCLQYADFRFMDGVAAWEETLRACPLERLAARDISREVQRGMELNSARSNALVERHLPRVLRSLGRDFAGVEGARVHRALRDGGLSYRSYLFRKPLATD